MGALSLTCALTRVRSLCCCLCYCMGCLAASVCACLPACLFASRRVLSPSLGNRGQRQRRFVVVVCRRRWSLRYVRLPDQLTLWARRVQFVRSHCPHCRKCNDSNVAVNALEHDYHHDHDDDDRLIRRLNVSRVSNNCGKKAAAAANCETNRAGKR